MRRRLSFAVVLAITAVVATAAGAQSGSTLAVRPLPAHGLAVATAKATLFLDFKGRELARLPRWYDLWRAPHGELGLSRASGPTLVLHPATGALTAATVQKLLAAPRWAQRKRCRPAAVHGGTWYLTCPDGIVAMTEHGSPHTVARPRGSHEWVELAVSPDGKMVLANESRECDGRQAYVVPAAGGTPHRLVHAETTLGVGWTSAGEAVVWVVEGGVCSGKSLHPGVYAVGLDGARRTLLAGQLRAAATWGS